jgi:hypothetical protein
MFLAPTMSACSVCPQEVQEKIAWLLRLFSSAFPHAGFGHVWDVYAGLILWMVLPV